MSNKVRSTILKVALTLYLPWRSTF
jgi:hypothetical protein